MESKTMVTGGLALVVGLLLGYAFSPKGVDLQAIEKAVGARIDTATQAAGDGVSELRDVVSALDSRLADLSGQVASLEAQVGDAATSGAEETTAALSALDERLSETTGALRRAIGEAIGETAENQNARLENALAALSAQVGALGGAAGSDGDPAQAAQSEAQTQPEAAPAEQSEVAEAAAATESAEAQAEAVAEAPEPSEPPEGLTPGMTALLHDGAIRVFVSRVDDAAAAARLSMQGQMMAHLRQGHSIAVRPEGEYCRVTLNSVDRGHAHVSAACGDDLPEPLGITPGSMAVLGDGAARVFLSQVSDDESAARIAVNGFAVQAVQAGASIPAGDTGCAVTVDQIDRGHVTFGYNCGS